MGTARFEQLAAALADRDRDVSGSLEDVRRSLEALRERALASIEAFVRVACEHGSSHLTDIDVGPVEADEKHVDCVQFKVARGRWEITCVGKARGTITLVGPYCRGKPEKPCAHFPLPGAEADAALEDLLLDLLREASTR
jgi:hypothetical protein